MNTRPITMTFPTRPLRRSQVLPALLSVAMLLLPGLVSAQEADSVPPSSGEAEQTARSEDEQRIAYTLRFFDRYVEAYQEEAKDEDQSDYLKLTESAIDLKKAVDAAFTEATLVQRQQLVELVADAVRLLKSDGIRAGKGDSIDSVRGTFAAAVQELEAGKIEAATAAVQEKRVTQAIKFSKDRENFDWEAWRKVPVLYRGRVQPLDSYAEGVVTLVTGRSKYTHPVTGVKYKPEELVFLWVTADDPLWITEPILRCEFQPLREVLDRRRITDEETNTVDGTDSTVTFEPLEQPNIVGRSVRGDVYVGDEKVATFSAAANGLLVFDPADSVLNNENVGPIAKQVRKRSREGWGGSVVSSAFVGRPEIVPATGQIDTDSGVIELQFSEAVGQPVRLDVTYDYQRGVLPLKGTYVSFLDILNPEQTTRGKPQFWSADMQERLEAIEQGAKEKLEPGQIGSTAEDRQISIKLSSLTRHLGAFRSAYQGANLEVVPTIDPRALASPLRVEGEPDAWIPLNGIIEYFSWDQVIDPSVSAVMAPSPSALIEALTRAQYPTEHQVQLAQAQQQKYTLQPAIRAVEENLRKAANSYRDADAEKFEDASEKFLRSLNILAKKFEAQRRNMGKVDVDEIPMDPTIAFKTTIEQAKALDLTVQDRKLQRLAINGKQEDRFKQLETIAGNVNATREKLIQVQTAIVMAQQEKREIPEEVANILFGALEEMSTQIDVAKRVLLRIDRDAVENFPKLFDEPLLLGPAAQMLVQRYEPLELDEEHMEQSSYPGVDAMDTELLYNDLQPFASAWIFFLVAFLIAITGRMLKDNKWIFALALFVTGLALAWSTVGFGLRVVITERAPVTNMYETVVWVAYVVGALGLWFCLLPYLWPGLAWSWRMTGLPLRPDRDEAGSFVGFKTDQPDPVERQQHWLAKHMTITQSIGTVGVLALFSSLVWFFSASETTFQVTSLVPPIFDKSIAMSRILTWAVGLITVVLSSWYAARAGVSLVYAVFSGTLFIEPYRVGADRLWSQVQSRRWFLMGALPVAAFAMMLAYFVGIYNKDVLNPEIGSIAAVLRNNYWLTIHVLTIVSSYGAGALAWGLGNCAMLYYLFGRYRRTTIRTEPIETDLGTHAPAERADGQTFADRMRVTRRGLHFGTFMASIKQAVRGVTTEQDAEGEEAAVTKVRPPKEVATLADFGYKSMQVATLLLAVGTILGGLWADVSWGRFWDWDPKEVWALISLLVYVAVLHGRFAGWVREFGTNVGAVACFSAIIMSWYGVNYILPKIPGLVDGTGGKTSVGLHSYAGGDADGMLWVIGAVLLNGVLVVAAWARYSAETSEPITVAGIGSETDPAT